jgi:hypothetical protein
LTDAADVDFYRLESPEGQFARQSTAYISVRSLDAGTLIPEVTVFGDHRHEIPTSTLVNGNGEVLVQIPDVREETELKIKISSADTLPVFQQGNYELNVFFTKQPTEFEEFASGHVAADSIETRQLYVATPQLFHFALAVDGDDPQSGLLLQLFDNEDQVVHRIVAAQGQVRTSGSSLLMPGTYTLAAIPLFANDSTDQPMEFTLNGTVISDPFGIDPVLPDDTEFTCPNVDDGFCFPDGTQSTTAFNWDDFVVILEGLDLDVSYINDVLLSEWWNSYWESSPAAPAPIATPETYQTATNEDLSVSAKAGVLANDTSDGEVVIASIVRSPLHGELQLFYDGSFTYRPEAGFVGSDSFEYVASDLRNQSEPTSVIIVVGQQAILTGDVNQDGRVNAVDVDAISAAIRNGENQYDINLDGATNADDRSYLISTVLESIAGDSNLDGIFDSSDLVLVFIAGGFEDGIEGNAGWATGDWDGDGDFTTRDFVYAFQSGGYSNSAATQATARRGDVAAAISDRDASFRR